MQSLLRCTDTSLLMDAKIIFEMMLKMEPRQLTHENVGLLAKSWLDRFEALMRQDPSLSPTRSDQGRDKPDPSIILDGKMRRVA